MRKKQKKKKKAKRTKLTASVQQFADLLKDEERRREYRAVSVLGKGKFATVHKAVLDGQLFALKKVKMDDMSIPSREKCLKEVQLLQGLNHPHIIHYVDSFIDAQGELVIVLQWAEGGDLKSLIRRVRQAQRRFGERHVWSYCVQIASALAYMHQQRVMHRDLKPANIMLTRDNQVHLADFGLSRFFTEQTLEAFSKVGTPLYMAPEVLLGDGYEFSGDIWSLGCILYELCTLRSPFKPRTKGVNLYELFKVVKRGEYDPIPNDDNRYSGALIALIDSMLHKDPTRRPTASQVWEAAKAGLNQRVRKQSTSPSRPAQPSPTLAEAKSPMQLSGTTTDEGADAAPPPLAERPPKLASSNEYQLMEDALEMMRLVFRKRGGPADLPLSTTSRTHFCSAGSGELRDYRLLVAWLLSVLGFLDLDVDLDEADPTLSLRAAALATRELRLPIRSNVSNTALAQGRGVEACQLLFYLALVALNRAEPHGFVAGAPQYDHVQPVEDDLDAIVEDLEGLEPASPTSSFSESSSEDEDSPYAPAEQPAILPVLPPPADDLVLAWKAELESLVARGQLSHTPSSSTTLTSEWPRHVDASKRHAAALESDLDATSVLPRLVLSSERLADITQRFQAAEARLQRDPSVSALASQYADVSASRQDLEARTQELQHRREEMTSALAKLELRLHELSSNLQHAHDAHTQDAPLQRLRESIAALRQQNADLNLQIGVALEQLGRAPHVT